MRSAGSPSPKETPPRKLEALLGLFPESALESGCFEVVSGGDVPSPYQELLVHPAHMTVTLENYHGGPVRLHVLEETQTSDHYARRLVLDVDKGDPDPRVVLVGVMRIWLEHCQETVREAILGGKVPLGRILEENDVLRWIDPEGYLRVQLNAHLKALFRVGAEGDVTYGRLATIFCDGQRAVELLEIVAPEFSQ